jgi:folate receptor
MSSTKIPTIAPSTNAPSITPCTNLQNLYKDGKDLCENYIGFAGAFTYVPTTSPDYVNAYTMWWFTNGNPNDAVTQKRQKAGLFQPFYNTTDKCWLKSPGVTFHKEYPSSNGITQNECEPWRENACCEPKVVANQTALDREYGEEFKWDLCGPLSQACERFMVQEACFYECDPNVGLFRQFPPFLSNGQVNPDAIGMEWAIRSMPIQGDYCDSWFQACRNDMFCTVTTEDKLDLQLCPTSSGPLRSAPLTQTPTLNVTNLTNAPTYGSEVILTSGTVALITIGSILIAFLCGMVLVMIRRERIGTPMFGTKNNTPHLTSNKRTSKRKQDDETGLGETLNIT